MRTEAFESGGGPIQGLYVAGLVGGGAEWSTSLSLGFPRPQREENSVPHGCDSQHRNLRRRGRSSSDGVIIAALCGFPVGEVPAGT